MSAALRAGLDRALVGAVSYVLAGQGVEGSWTDWRLPPGSSSPWTTAYVGYQLCRLPAEFGKEARAARAAARRWLAAAAWPEGGWGYNARVGTDADSTAWALLFLAAEGGSADEEGYRRLLALQGADGGFATFRPGDAFGSWTVSHPEVSATAVLALLTRLARTDPAVERGVAYVLEQRTATGLWNSFWWSGPFYGTAASLSLLTAAGVGKKGLSTRRQLLRLCPRNAFDSSLFVASALLAGVPSATPAVGAALDRLLSDQNGDGSWDGAPVLRVTRRDCYEPWCEADGGSLHSDPNRLFTTATVLGVLSDLRRRHGPER